MIPTHSFTVSPTHTYTYYLAHFFTISLFYYLARYHILALTLRSSFFPYLAPYFILSLTHTLTRSSGNLLHYYLIHLVTSRSFSFTCLLSCSLLISSTPLLLPGSLLVKRTLPHEFIYSLLSYSVHIISLTSPLTHLLPQYLSVPLCPLLHFLTTHWPLAYKTLSSRSPHCLTRFLHEVTYSFIIVIPLSLARLLPRYVTGYFTLSLT